MEVTKDPFSVLSLASVEPVIQHLTVQEVLEISEVSKGWYEKTANMESFSRRLKVDVKCNCGVNNQSRGDNSELTEETALVILQSQRKLHTLEVQLCCRCLSIVKGLFLDAKHRKEWKYVTITHSQFELMPWLVMYLVDSGRRRSNHIAVRHGRSRRWHRYWWSVGLPEAKSPQYSQLPPPNASILLQELQEPRGIQLHWWIAASRLGSNECANKSSTTKRVTADTYDRRQRLLRAHGKVSRLSIV